MTGSVAPGSQTQTYSSDGSEVIVHAARPSPRREQCEATIDQLGVKGDASLVLREQRDADQMRGLKRDPKGNGWITALHFGNGLDRGADALSKLGLCPTPRKTPRAYARAEKSGDVEAES
jgi:hypothetical protein